MTYDVLVTKKEKKFIARVCAWPEILVQGETEEEVLRKAQADLQGLLRSGRIVQLTLDVKPEEHPWRQFAGMFAADPDWDEFQAVMQQYRENIDNPGAEDSMSILDTDHISLFQRRHPQVSACILATPPVELATTVVTVEEQLRGRLERVRRARSDEEVIRAYQR